MSDATSAQRCYSRPPHFDFLEPAQPSVPIAYEPRSTVARPLMRVSASTHRSGWIRPAIRAKRWLFRREPEPSHLSTSSKDRLASLATLAVTLAKRPAPSVTPGTADKSCTRRQDPRGTCPSSPRTCGPP